MNARGIQAALVGLALFALFQDRAYGQSDENRTVDMASQVLQEIMAVPAKSIPQSLLASAEGIAIVPNVIRAGFVVGGRFGKGVVLIRDETRNWTAPTFISLTGGSLGWQAGVQATDVILVFRTRKSVSGLLNGQFTIGADAAVAAGPVGRQAAAATDATFQAEILSYSRSRGLFAGVALDGSMIQIDRVANANYYQSYTATGPTVPAAAAPPSAARLIGLISQYTGGTPENPGPSGFGPSGLAPSGLVPIANDQDAIRRKLVTESSALQRILDPEWRKFVALPAEVYQGANPPSPGALRATLERFDQVANDPQYASLAQRPEFQGTWRTLRQYYDHLGVPMNGTINLPPPPPPGSAGFPGPPR